MKTLKYLPEETTVVFREIPDEITLAINITGCPIRCPGCHSKHLWEDIGEELNINSLSDMIKKNEGITCVCFMGGDGREWDLELLASYVHGVGLKTAWYSGRQELPSYDLLRVLDYVKIGPYIEELGPLNSKITNQRLYKLRHCHSLNYPIVTVSGEELYEWVEKEDITESIK